jgi:hypothetical protein
VIKRLVALGASALVVLAMAGCGTPSPSIAVSSSHHKPQTADGFTPNPVTETTQPGQPGPVSGQARLVGACLMGSMPTGQGAVFVPGPPQTQTISGQSYYPVVGYKLTLINKGTDTADVTGWVVAFYDSNGNELGSDQETISDEFLTGGQEFQWIRYAPTDTDGNSQNFGDDSSIPSDGSAYNCQLVEWLTGTS